MRRWLVTGGVGFIGHHVTQALLERGDAVCVLDDFSNGPYPETLKRRHAKTLARAGMTMDDLVSVQVFCSDVSLYHTFNAEYARRFVAAEFPARAFLGSGPLLRGCRFEVSGVAVRR